MNYGLQTMLPLLLLQPPSSGAGVAEVIFEQKICVNLGQLVRIYDAMMARTQYTVHTI